MLGLWVVIAPIHVAGQQRGRSPLLLCRCCRYDAEKVGVSPGAVFEFHFRALNLQEVSDVLALRAWAICQSHGIFRALDSWHAGSAWRLPRLFRVAMRATLAAHAAFGGASSPLRRESRPSCDGREAYVCTALLLRASWRSGAVWSQCQCRWWEQQLALPSPPEVCRTSPTLASTRYRGRESMCQRRAWVAGTRGLEGLAHSSSPSIGTVQ